MNFRVFANARGNISILAQGMGQHGEPVCVSLEVNEADALALSQQIRDVTDEPALVNRALVQTRLRLLIANNDTAA